MNRSYSKIRHIQEVNQRLENRLLNEQINKTTNVPAGTTGTSNTTGTSGSTSKPIVACPGSNEISEPLVTLGSKGGKVGEGQFELKIYFKSTGTSGDVIKKGLIALKNKIMGNLDPKNYKPININKIILVTGSASNRYLNDPLQPTLSNYGVGIKDLKNYENFAGSDNVNYITNFNFAEKRWDSIYKIIKNEKSLFSIPNEITVTPLGYITDTGGCIDEKRDTSKYPNPGQYAIIRGEYSVSPSDFGISTITECIDKLKMVVGYFKESKSTDEGIKIKTNDTTKGTHECDYATFDVYCNHTFLATVNLNNGFSSSDSSAKIGTEPESTYPYCTVKYYKPTKKGGTVYSVLALTEIGVKEIIKKSDSGKLEFSMTGNKNALTNNSKGIRYVHGDAPMVLVYNASDNRVIYHQQPNSTNEKFVPFNHYFELGEFSACPTPATAKK